MSQNTKPRSTWVEINKMIAEKQTIYVEQMATISAYKHALLELTKEGELIDQRCIMLKMRNETMEASIVRTDAETQRLAANINVLQRDNFTRQQEVTSMRQKIARLQAEDAAERAERSQQLADMRDTVLRNLPQYDEYQTLREKNVQLSEEIARMKAESDDLTHRAKMAEEQARLDRNRKIVELVTDVQEWRKQVALQKKYDQLCVECKAVTEELLDAIRSFSYTAECIAEEAPIEDEQAVTDRNLWETELNNTVPANNQATAANVWQEQTFKVPAVPDMPSTSTDSKVVILQNVELASSQPETTSSSDKRKNEYKSGSLIKKHKSVDTSWNEAATAVGQPAQPSKAANDLLALFGGTEMDATFLEPNEIQSQSKFFTNQNATTNTTSPASNHQFDFQTFLENNSDDGDNGNDNGFINFSTEINADGESFFKF